MLDEASTPRCETLRIITGSSRPPAFMRAGTIIRWRRSRGLFIVTGPTVERLSRSHAIPLKDVCLAKPGSHNREGHPFTGHDGQQGDNAWDLDIASRSTPTKSALRERRSKLLQKRLEVLKERQASKFSTQIAFLARAPEAPKPGVRRLGSIVAHLISKRSSIITLFQALAKSAMNFASPPLTA